MKQFDWHPGTLLEMSGYYWKTHIRPVGTTWRESVFGLGFLPFSVIEEPVWELELVSEGWPLEEEPGRAALTVTVKESGAKAIANAHGGDIRVQSTPLAGSTFQITLPR